MLFIEGTRNVFLEKSEGLIRSVILVCYEKVVTNIPMG